MFTISYQYSTDWGQELLRRDGSLLRTIQRLVTIDATYWTKLSYKCIMHRNIESMCND